MLVLQELETSVLPTGKAVSDAGFLCNMNWVSQRTKKLQCVLPNRMGRGEWSVSSWLWGNRETDVCQSHLSEYLL